VTPRTSQPVPVAGYTRISRVGGRRGEGFISEDDQREGILLKADQMGCEIVEWFHDPDFPGDNMQRPAWERCLARVEDTRDPLRGVIVVYVDRFARSVPESAPIVQRIWDSNGGRGIFAAADLPMDTRTDEGRWALWQFLANAELFHRRIKRSWWRAKRRAIERGAHIGRTPLGMDRVPKGEPGSGTLVPKKEWVPVVRKLFKHAARHQDWGLGKLERWANEHAVRPDEKLWTSTTIGNLLKNRIWLGEVAYRPQTDPRRRKTKESFEPMHNATAHKPVIDEATWLRAQRTPKNTRPHAKTHGRNDKSAGQPALLQGLVRCAGCRHAMSPSIGGNGVLVYHCGGRVRSSGRCPLRASVARRLIDAYVEQVFREQFLAAHGDLALETAETGTVDDEMIDALQAAREEAWGAYERIAQDLELLNEDRDAWRLARDAARGRGEAADAAYRSAVQAMPKPRVLPTPLQWERLTPAQKNSLMSDVIDAVFVRESRGRGRHARIEERVLILWAGEAAKLDLELPGKGRPAPELRGVQWPNPDDAHAV
jgi:site-specific DNA recombinase